MHYVKTDGEYAAFYAVPSVLKHGEKIYDNISHKGTGIETITFASPVIINGVRGNMAVTVKKDSRSFYHAHRIVMPDGSVFEFSEKENSPGLDGGQIKKSLVDSPTVTASDNSISKAPEKSNRKFSLKDDAEIQEIINENESLKDRIDEQDAIIAELRRQMKPTDPKRNDRRDIVKYARELKKSYNSELSEDFIADTLDEMYTEMMRKNPNDAYIRQLGIGRDFRNRRGSNRCARGRRERAAGYRGGQR